MSVIFEKEEKERDSKMSRLRYISGRGERRRGLGKEFFFVRRERAPILILAPSSGLERKLQSAEGGANILAMRKRICVIVT